MIHRACLRVIKKQRHALSPAYTQKVKRVSGNYTPPEGVIWKSDRWRVWSRGRNVECRRGRSVFYQFPTFQKLTHRVKTKTDTLAYAANSPFAHFYLDHSLLQWQLCRSLTAPFFLCFWCNLSAVVISIK
jgi:hypothetical protein